MEARHAVEKALEVAQSVGDPELRKVAFGSLLAHFLARGVQAPAARKAEDPPPRDEPSPVRGEKTPKNGGPKARLESLREEGFFAAPRTAQDILTALSERRHHMRHEDLTWPLVQMVKERELRRKKDAVGGKQVWRYSNW